MTTTVIIVFAVVYLGMILGGLPLFQLDRTGVALIWAFALVAVGDVSLEEAGRSIHAPTLILLFAFMVLSAQLRLGGFYTFVTHRLAALPLAPPLLLGALIVMVGTLAGNLLIVGSIANIIVVNAAERRGLRIDWRRHARIGVPVTLATLAIAGAYLWLRLA